MWESHRLSFQTGGDPEIIDHYLFTLCCTLLDACEAGLLREEIEKILRDGFHHGELQHVDPSLTPEYWEAVYQESKDKEGWSE